MTIEFRFYKEERDLELQYAFWEEMTADLPYAWKKTKSPTLFKKQKGFHPHSRCFAFDGEDLIGYMSFTGSGDFVSLGYPWVKDGYLDIRDTLYDKVYGFASSNQYGGKRFAQRFREQWNEQIDYFLSKGFEITNKSIILGKPLTEEHASLNPVLTGSWKIEEGFTFSKWKRVIERNQDISAQELSMMEDYYNSVDFDFSLVGEAEGETVGVFGMTLRKDTKYAEVLAVSLQNEYKTKFEEIFQAIMKEVYKRGGRQISVYKSDVPLNCQIGLNLRELSKDVMVMKTLD